MSTYSLFHFQFTLNILSK